MAGKDMVMVSREELKRLHIIQRVFEKRVRQVEAARILFLSTRQIRRIIKRVRREGEAGISHRSRGRPSNRRFPQKIKAKAIKLYQQKYTGFGPTLAAEKLSEADKVTINHETLRQWLIESGDWKKNRKRRVHRQWRQRKQYFGEMIQIDGSHHNWLEGRGPTCVLLGYIDDATGTIFGRFYRYEGTMPAMESFKRYIKKYGIPLSVYLDKHTTYRSTAKPSLEDELSDTKPLSEFERALQELGVEVIHAHSPQAKGRVERLFKTLQDRLIKEMRLRGIRTIEGANTFLEHYLSLYNKKFAIKPQEKEDLHRATPKGLKLDTVLCRKTERSLRNDFTIVHNKKLYQIEENVRVKKVVVEERIDGSMLITYKGARLRFQEIPEKPIIQQKQLHIPTSKKKYIPPPDHPWKKYKSVTPKTRYQYTEVSV
jgi:transposase